MTATIIIPILSFVPANSTVPVFKLVAIQALPLPVNSSITILPDPAILTLLALPPPVGFRSFSWTIAVVAELLAIVLLGFITIVFVPVGIIVFGRVSPFTSNVPPPKMVFVIDAPKAAGLPILKVPALIAVGPENVLAPDRTSVVWPFFDRTALPLIMPDNVTSVPPFPPTLKFPLESANIIGAANTFDVPACTVTDAPLALLFSVKAEAPEGTIANEFVLTNSIPPLV